MTKWSDGEDRGSGVRGKDKTGRRAPRALAGGASVEEEAPTLTKGARWSDGSMFWGAAPVVASRAARALPRALGLLLPPSGHLAAVRAVLAHLSALREAPAFPRDGNGELSAAFRARFYLGLYHDSPPRHAQNLRPCPRLIKQPERMDRKPLDVTRFFMLLLTVTNY